MDTRIEVTDQYGTAAQIMDPAAVLARLSPRKLRIVEETAAELVEKAADRLNWPQEHARGFIMACLARMVVDDDAYERVAAQRGMLPL